MEKDSGQGRRGQGRGGQQGRSARSTASAVADEKKSFESDQSTTALDSTSKCCSLSVTRRSDRTVNIKFDSTWISKLMATSCDSLVPFQYYGLGWVEHAVQSRIYPRSYHKPIRIGPKTYEDPKFGGRSRMDKKMAERLEWAMDELYALVDQQNCIDRTCRLGDLLIFHKRTFTRMVVEQFKGLTLECLNRLADKSLYTTGGLFEYPLLCIYFTDHFASTSTNFANRKQGYARICQVYFAALLNRRLLEAACPIEVVSREGFGSCIPAVSDLGDGIRLDPGFLPLECTVIVLDTLKATDAFMDFVMTESRSTEVASLADNLCGFGAEQLLDVDKLMFALTCSDLNRLKHDQVLGVLKKPSSAKGEPPNRFASNVTFTITVADVPALPPEIVGHVLHEISEPTEDAYGYGSDSDDEFATPEIEELEDDFCIRKAAFISGIGGIRLINYLSKIYIKQLPTKFKSKVSADDIGKLQPASHYAYYFELDDLDKVTGVSHFNAAPDARSNKDAQLPQIGDDLVCTIDVTNVTTAEKGDYVCQHILKCSGAGSEFKLLILEESASKHGTGGDLVYGVARVIGRKAAVKYFFAILAAHLSDADKEFTTVLEGSEHKVRRLLQRRHLMPRNRDLVSYVNSKLSTLAVASEETSESKSRKTKEQEKKTPEKKTTQ